MYRILSLQIALPSILILAFGGYTMIDEFPLSSWVIWTVAILWFGGMILYLPQRVSIEIDKCSLESTHRGNTVIVEGLIKARHKDCIKEFRLYLYGDIHLAQVMRGHYPDDVDSTFVKFMATFDVPTEVLGKSDNGYFSVVLPKREWKSKAFKIPLGNSSV